MIEGNRVRYSPYGNEDLRGRQLPYGRFHHDPRGDFVQPNYLSYSDYSGSTVERSNVRVFAREFAEHQGTDRDR